MKLNSALPLLSLALLAACGGGGDNKADTTTGTVAPDAQAPAAASADPDFQPEQLQKLGSTSKIACPAYKSFDLASNGFECFSSDVPENYKQPDKARIQVLSMVKRTSALQPKGTIYLLDGGPGGNGLAIARHREVHTALNSDGWDVIIPGHRGTHMSRLSCLSDASAAASAPSPAQACIEELIASKGALALSQYDTVNAARDIVMAQPVLGRGTQTAALGVSYGTYWAQRLAQLYPASAGLVILDSSLNLRGKLEELDLHTESLLHDVLADCQADTVCGRLFGTDTPQAATQKAVANINSGQCGAALTSQDTTPWKESGFNDLVNAAMGTPEAQPLLPYLIKIAAECNVPYVKALLAHDQTSRAARDQPSTEADSAEMGVNGALFQTVVATELVNANSPDTQANIDRVIAAVKGRAAGDRGNTWDFKRDLDAMKALVFNKIVRSFSTVKAKVLVLSAYIDPATPRQVTQEMLGHMRSEGLAPQAYEPRYAGHGVISTSGQNDCGLRRVRHFLDGREASTFSCTQELIDWTFSRPATRAVATELIGKANPWNEVTLPIESRPSGTSGI